MFHIPDATIHTLRELMEPGGTAKYQEHIAYLGGLSVSVGITIDYWLKRGTVCSPMAHETQGNFQGGPKGGPKIHQV